MVRTTLAAIGGVTAAASCWLMVMCFVLRHPGYEWRAGIAALFVIQSALTPATFARERSPAND